MGLFLDDHPELVERFRKEAGYTHRLSEAPENWSQEIGSELYKQLPFLSDYEVNVNLDKQDPGRGFAFGYADVSNFTERPEVEHEEAGIPHIRIPLIAEERQVRPFSVYLDGERVLPLNEERIRETLFNPAAFDLSNSIPRDPSLVESLMPPQRSGMGLGGEYKMASAEDKFIKQAFKHISKEQWDAIYKSNKIQGLVKKHGIANHPEVTNAVYELATKTYGYHPKVYPPSPKQMAEQAMKDSEKLQKKQTGLQDQLKKTQGQTKKASLLVAIAPTIREEDKEAFLNKIASSPTIKAGFRKSGMGPILVEAMEAKTATVHNRLEKLSASIPPSTVTFQKLPGGDFLVKAASVTAFENNQASKGEVLPFAEVAEAIGEDTAQSMQPGQFVTTVSDPVDLREHLQTSHKAVSEFGEYKVQDTNGRETSGWVFPNLLSWDKDFTLQQTPVFANDSSYAIQKDIAGEFTSNKSKPPSDIPSGEGVFWGNSAKGTVATAPLTIAHGMNAQDGIIRYSAMDPFGNEIKVSKIPGLKEPKAISDKEFLIPNDWNFTRLRSKMSLAGNSSEIGTASKVKKEKTSAVLFYNGSYNLTGSCGLDQVATDLRQDLDPVSAEFMLGVLGVDGVTAKQKVAEARKKGSVKLAGLKTIILLSDRYEEAVKTASVALSNLPDLRRDLIKEAAAIEDTGTVDKVLALNFINPENLETFVEYLPELEDTSERMAEMVLAGYLGMKEVPVEAVERTMNHMEDVIVGLKAIQHSNT